MAKRKFPDGRQSFPGKFYSALHSPFSELHSPGDQSAGLTEQTPKELLRGGRHRCSSRQHFRGDAIDLRVRQGLGFISFHTFEEAIEQRFGLRGQRLEMLVEQMFSCLIANLPVSILARELFRMRFECLVGELFQSFAEES